ncbi:MAG: hypothetical protein ACJAYC_000281 [Halieaceae bacterium]|jgi:hypothetical protein
MMPSPKNRIEPPWYRQFWPWFIMALPVSVVVAGLVTFYIANRHADDLVVDEYYKEGLAINRQLAKKQRAADLGITAKLLIQGSTLRLWSTGPIRDPILRLRLAHPMEADRDFQISLARRNDGSYSAPLAALVAAHWHSILDSGESSGENSLWRLDGSLSEVNFEPGSAH